MTTAMTFQEFVHRADPAYRWDACSESVHDALMDVADGRRTRLLVIVPPRHGKTTLARLFMAYHQSRNPAHAVIASSYSHVVAAQSVEKARRYLANVDGVRAPANITPLAVGGSLCARGIDLAAVDDPIRDMAEAMSFDAHKHRVEWWHQCVLNRLNAGGALVVFASVWPGYDFAHGLLAADDAAGEHHAERWHVIALDALRDTKTPRRVPATCTLADDPRLHGEPLYASHCSRERLLSIRRDLGPIAFDALYQGRVAASPYFPLPTKPVFP